jgi:formylglycine-generating enzyme required for sulfatase activity
MEVRSRVPVRIHSSLPRWCAIVYLAGVVLFLAVRPGVSQEPAPTAGGKARPLLAVANSVAKSEQEMKSYTDRIPNTQAKFDMLPIPGGTFTMGSPDDEEDRFDDEGPQFKVKVEPFWMGKCEVSWDEYEPFMMCLDIAYRRQNDVQLTSLEKNADAVSRPTKPYTDMTFGMGKEGYPAICMTQLAAGMYCKWLTQKTGRYYRLPTEAEWEYACRAGTKTPYSFGDDPDEIDGFAWHIDNSEETYQKVGKKKPNPWGLHDMHGNVAEWVLDQHVEGHYAKFSGKTVSVVEALAIPTKLFPRVVRGGSWDDDLDAHRSAARITSTPDWKEQDPQFPQSIWYHTDAVFVGLRVVRPLREPTAEEKKKIWDAGLIVPKSLPSDKKGCNHE